MRRYPGANQEFRDLARAHWYEHNPGRPMPADYPERSRRRLQRERQEREMILKAMLDRVQEIYGSE